VKEKGEFILVGGLTAKVPKKGRPQIRNGGENACQSKGVWKKKVHNTIQNLGVQEAAWYSTRSGTRPEDPRKGLGK